LLSAVRSILLVVGGLAVGKGWLDSAALDSIVGGAMALVAAWGVYSKRPGSTEALLVAQKVADVRPAIDLIATPIPPAPAPMVKVKDLLTPKP
jgi:hypothetical protein